MMLGLFISYIYLSLWLSCYWCFVDLLHMCFWFGWVLLFALGSMLAVCRL